MRRVGDASAAHRNDPCLLNWAEEATKVVIRNPHGLVVRLALASGLQ